MMVDKIWSYQIQVLPVVIAFGLFQIPSILHRLKKQYYVPIYFSIFPFNIINFNLSKYLADDYFGEEMSDVDAEIFRGKLIYTSALSLTISTIAIPSFTGFIGAFFLTKETLFQFLLFLLVYKLVSIIKSIINFHHNAIATTKKRILLSLIYFFYIGIVVNIIKSTFHWAQPYILKSDWMGLLSALNKFCFYTIGIKGIIVLIITSAFSYYFADRNIRKENLQRMKSWSEDTYV